MEHLTQIQVEDYSQRRLQAAELLAVSDHLAQCGDCRARVEAALNVDDAFFALHEDAFAESTSAHLTSEQTADYVDQNLAGETLAMVRDHLGSCEQCVLAVNDLRAFRNQIAPTIDREYGPTTTAVQPVPVRGGEGEKWARLFRAPAPAFGAALAVLLLVAIAWFVWRTPRANKPEVAVAPTPVPQSTPAPEPSLQPQPAPAVMAQLNDGGSVLSLDQDGRLTGADNLPPVYQSLVKKALSTQKIDRSPQLQGLSRASSALMGSDNGPDFVVVEPVGRVLLSDRPAFRWSRAEGASGYVVEIYDEQFKLVASSAPLTVTSWTAPDRLARGHLYSWQVKTTKDGQEITAPRPPAPQAKFRVLDQTKANEIVKAKQTYGSSHLVLGLLYADAGLQREAEQELRLLLRANPNSDVAKNLLRELRK